MNSRNIIISIIIIILVLGGIFVYISENTQDTKIAFVSNTTVQNGDNLTIQLKGLYKNAIPDQEINLKILDDSGWAHKYNVTTNETGEGSIQILGFDNGNYTLHADYNGTLFLKESHQRFPFTIDDGYS